MFIYVSVGCAHHSNSEYIYVGSTGSLPYNAVENVYNWKLTAQYQLHVFNKKTSHCFIVFNLNNLYLYSYIFVLDNN